MIIGGMNPEQDDASIRAYFEKHGALTKCKVLWGKGRAFIEYEDHTTARKALKATNGDQLDGAQLLVEFTNAAPGGGNDGASGEATTVFVGNLGFRTQQWAIEEFFKDCG